MLVYSWILELIGQMAHIFDGVPGQNPRTDIIRISEIHPVYVNIDMPAGRSIRMGIEEANLDFDACEKFKAKCEPVAFFPGQLENNFPLCAYPIYLVVPWQARDITVGLYCMQGLVLFNRVIGPDRVIGPQFDNELGQWGAVSISDELVLANLPYLEHDRGLKLAIGENWHDLFWLRELLQGKKTLYKLKSQ